jgi:phosphohistidine swiveling domain-containing protein
MMENKEHLWYPFGRWEEPVLTIPFWLDFKKPELDFDVISVVKVLKYSNYFLKEDLKKLEEFIEDKIINDKEWFEKFFDICEERVNNILSFKDGDDLKGFFEAAAIGLSTSYITIISDYGLQKYIEKLAKEKDVLMSDILANIRPFKKTHLMKYQEDLEILTEEDISEFVKKYHWVGRHLFLGDYLTEEKVKKELEELKNKVDEPAFRKLPIEFDNVVEIGSKLAYYRTYFIESFNMVADGYERILEDIAKNNNLTIEDLKLLTPKELFKLEETGKVPEGISVRSNGEHGIIWERDKGIRMVLGDELEKQVDECVEKVDYDSIKEIKGMVAFRGEETVRGVVKVVLHVSKIGKLQPGEILVAAETTPDYLVGMRVAGGIITNMGGVTSHAAIVARELGKPCIIGTKIATEVLKDGDLVEVDTEKGIVKILEWKR